MVNSRFVAVMTHEPHTASRCLIRSLLLLLLEHILLSCSCVRVCVCVPAVLLHVIPLCLCYARVFCRSKTEEEKVSINSFMFDLLQLRRSFSFVLNRLSLKLKSVEPITG